ncbi:GNAT family N-acetyltransferase [Spirosoma soli]|uniref:GNAT family N-acetyltransferase n=1 Tax=Spirosoma soli TaxID=1770529 RepID=A0ABW5M6S6_9BACT
MTVLETKRLRLSQLSVDQAPFILELLNTPSWLAYIGDRGVRTLDDARNYLLNGPIASYNRFGFGLYLVTLIDTDVPIGLCGLLQRETLDHPDIGFAFLPDYMHKGYGFEAASAVMTYARTTLGVGGIMAITVTHNENSIKLLKKLGFHFERLITFAPGTEELMLFVN